MEQTIRSMMVVYGLTVVLQQAKETEKCKDYLASKPLALAAKECVDLPVFMIAVIAVVLHF
jgi:hypothetical protein